MKLDGSLRDRQREHRRQQILMAAGELFTEAGFDETTMEQIADKAMVSVPTVYSYFNSKSELLFALFEADELMIEPRIEALMNKLPSNPVEAIVLVELTALREGYDISQKRVWREISAAALRAQGEHRSEYISLQNLRVDWLRQVLETLKSRGDVREDLDCKTAASVIYGIGRNCFRMYVMDEKKTVSQLETQIRSEIGLFFQGIAASSKPSKRKAHSSTVLGK